MLSCFFVFENWPGSRSTFFFIVVSHGNPDIQTVFSWFFISEMVAPGRVLCMIYMFFDSSSFNCSFSKTGLDPGLHTFSQSYHMVISAYKMFFFYFSFLKWSC